MNEGLLSITTGLYVGAGAGGGDITVGVGAPDGVGPDGVVTGPGIVLPPLGGIITPPPVPVDVEGGMTTGAGTLLVLSGGIVGTIGCIVGIMLPGPVLPLPVPVLGDMPPDGTG